jgi:hypothetical protein
MSNGGFINGGGGGFFVESDHPRDAKGEFASKGGSGEDGSPGGRPGSGSERGKSTQRSPRGAGKNDQGNVAKATAKATATVDASQKTRAAAKEYFGREMSDRDFQELMGAPDGAQIMVDALDGGNLVFHVQHPLYQQMHLAYAVQMPNGMKFLRLELYHLKDNAPEGMGAQAFGQWVKKGRELGLKAIYIPTAARNSQMVGYYVWPRFGADEEIPEELISELPESLKSCKDLSDLMKSKEGKEWWRAKGITTSCAFELDPESVSSQIWADYCAEKGIPQ